jgi:hypothetical protein
MTKFARLAIVGLLLLPCVPLFVYLGEKFLGYYPGDVGWRVAPIAASRKDASLCKRIISPPWIQFFGPTTAEQRLDCINQYASITKDPRVCELLLPYALGCVAGAIESVPCLFTDEFTIVWQDDGLRREVAFQECLKDDPDRSRIGKLCCRASAAKFLLATNNCNSVQEDNHVHDQCQLELALKTLSPEQCSAVVSPNLRASCEIMARAFRDEPRLRLDLIRPLDSVESLP